VNFHNDCDYKANGTLAMSRTGLFDDRHSQIRVTESAVTR
jgi:hypothetical protein